MWPADSSTPSDTGDTLALRDEASQGGAALSVRGLSAGYSRTPIIEDIDLDVRPSEIVLVAGPNGAGKSTLVKAIVGALPRLAGRVSVLGRDVTGYSSAELTRAGVGYVPQQDDVFLSLSVHDNLLLGGYLLGRKDRQHQAERQMERFPALAAARSRTAKTLSGGQRKTLALARALMLEPQVVVLDEPTAGLSPKVAANVLQEVVSPLAELGRAVLMVEQRVSDALTVAERIDVLVSGRLALSESARAFSERPDAGRWLMGAGELLAGGSR